MKKLGINNASLRCSPRELHLFVLMEMESIDQPSSSSFSYQQFIYLCFSIFNAHVTLFLSLYVSDLNEKFLNFFFGICQAKKKSNAFGKLFNQWPCKINFVDYHIEKSDLVAFILFAVILKFWVSSCPMTSYYTRD